MIARARASSRVQPLSRSLFSRASDEWFTPRHILDGGKACDPLGRFALDPCWHPDSLVVADHTRARVLGEDGLALDWSTVATPGRVVWCNPPYSAIAAWLARCARHFHIDRGAALGLVPARTDTRWFHEHALSARGACFIRGRLKFANVGTRYSAPFPSVLLYWGNELGRFRRAFEPLGWCVDPDRVPF